MITNIYASFIIVVVKPQGVNELTTLDMAVPQTVSSAEYCAPLVSTLYDSDVWMIGTMPSNDGNLAEGHWEAGYHQLNWYGIYLKLIKIGFEITS